MAPPRTRAASEDDDGGEVFTDLRGRPDGSGDDDAALLEQELGTEDDEGEDEEDDDGDDETGAEGDETGEGEEGEEGEDEGEDGEAEVEAEDDGAARADDFDPKDAILLTKDAENLELRKQGFTQAKTQAETDLAAAEKAMETAKEAGDTKGDVAATKAFAQATAAMERATNNLGAIATEEAALKRRAAELYAKAPKDKEGNVIMEPRRAARGTADGKTGAAPSKLAPKFAKLNPWFGNEKYAKQQKRLLQIDKGLAAEGHLDKNSTAYFTELGRRFNSEFPGLFKDLDGKLVATGQRQRGRGTPIPGQGGSGGSGGADRGAGGKVKFTDDDKKQMKVFGLDPDNKDQRREWLRNKQALAGR